MNLSKVKDSPPEKRDFGIQRNTKMGDANNGCT
jgi:hypothetical protein